MNAPGKTVGTGVGATGAALYATDLTALSLYWTGGEALPAHVLEATTSLLNGFWAGVLLVAGLWAGHVWNKANARWGDQSTASV